MQVHKVTLIVFDFDKIGAESVKKVLENTKYPNHCINPKVESIQSKDIGEWSDEHPLNKRATYKQALANLFNDF